jgi:hypothetical protein
MYYSKSQDCCDCEYSADFVNRFHRYFLINANKGERYLGFIFYINLI